MTVGRALLLAVLAGAIAAPCASGDDDPDKPFGKRDALKAKEQPVSPQEPVVLRTEDGYPLAASYSTAGAPPGGGALVLVHGEKQARSAFDELLGRLSQHRVPWLAIDLRGHGASATQAGKDLSAAAAKGDPAVFGGAGEDVWAAVRWLVDVKKHDPKLVGILAAGGLGGAAALRTARLHRPDVAAVMLMTPSLEVPGFDPLDDAHGLLGATPFVILCGAGDWDKPALKKGPRHLLYTVKYARDAPKDTPLDERIIKRRGIPPRIRAFAEDGTWGTKAFGRVLHLDAWVAAWWARFLGTYRSPVLYDGYVDTIGDYADPGWAAGTAVPAGSGPVPKVARWGLRMMVGGELPPDTVKILLRVRVARGEVETGQLAAIAYPLGFVEAAPMQHGGRRTASIETTALVIQPDTNPVADPEAPPPRASFEAEVFLPELQEKGDYLIRVSVAYLRTSGAIDEGPGVDPSRHETWTLVPDLEAPGGIPPARDAPKPPK